MNLKRTPRLDLERLDDRITPTISVFRSPQGVLNIAGNPNDVLLVQQTATNILKVTDGVANYGTYNAPGGLNISLTRFNQAVLVDVGNFTYQANININLGLGSVAPFIREVSIFDGNGSAGGLGKVGGNVQVVGGNGSEFISIGRPAATATVDIPVQVNGYVFVTTKFNSGPDTFELVPGSIVQNSIYLTNVDNTSLGFFDPAAPTLAKVGGNVVINTPTPRTAFTTDIYALVNGNVTVVSNQGSNKLSAVNLNDGTVIGGLTAVLTNGFNFVNFGTQVSGQPAPFIGGNVTVVCGTNSDVVAWLNDPVDGDAAIAAGNVSFALNQGDNSLLFDSFAYVAGNMGVRAGNGNNFIGGTNPPDFGFDGTVEGNLSFSLGNGDNTINFGGTVSGNQFGIYTGGGDDSVTLLASASAPAARLVVFLNGGDDVLNVDSVNFGSAFLDGGGFDADDFNSSIIIPITWKIQNFEL